MNENRQSQIRDSLTLETLCEYCNGGGGESVEGSGRWCRCTMCNGSGYVLTEMGERVLSLVRHNLKPMLEDVSG